MRWRVVFAIAVACGICLAAPVHARSDIEQWRLDTSKQSVLLLYGEEATDNFGSFRFSCKPQQGEIRVQVVLNEEDVGFFFQTLSTSKMEEPKIRLGLGQDDYLPDQLTYDEFNGWILNFTIPTTEPAIGILAQTGIIEMHLASFSKRGNYPVNRQIIGVFRSRCEKQKK